jgi:hypothetical protein
MMVSLASQKEQTSYIFLAILFQQTAYTEG